MPRSFDPYLEWFGIPADQQPPNHYRLLGVDMFESSKAKIDDAIMQRAEFLQAMSSGKHVEQAQAILNQVAKARLCLVKPEKKKAYDQELRAFLAKPKSKPSEAAPKAAVFVPTLEVASDREMAMALNELQLQLSERKRTAGSSKSGRKSSRGKSKSISPIALGGILAAGCAVLVAAIVVFLFWSPDKVADTRGGNSNDPANNLGQLNSSVTPQNDRHSISGELPVLGDALRGDQGNPKGKASSSMDGREHEGRKTAIVEGELPVEPIQPNGNAGDNSNPSPASKPNSKPKPRPKKRPAKAPAKPKPAPAKPTPVAKSNPLKFPAEPFKGFAKTRELPAFDQLSPVSFGNLFIAPDTDLNAEFAFEKSACKSKHDFKLRPVENRLRDWIVSMVPQRGEPVDVAKLWHKDYQLYFQWIDGAEENKAKINLRNGILNLSAARGQSHSMVFRRPVSIKPGKWDERTKSLELKSPKCTLLPANKSLKLKVNGTDDSTIKLFQASPTPLNEEAIVTFVENSINSRAWLELKTSVKKSALVVQAKLLMNLDGKARPYDQSAFEGLVRQQNDGIKQLAGKISKMKAGAEKNKSNAILKEFRAVAEVTRAQMDAANKIQTAKLKVSVVHQLGEREILIARSGYSGKGSGGSFASSVAELSDYQLIYDTRLKIVEGDFQYDLDVSASVNEFDRVAYLLSYSDKAKKTHSAFVSMESFTNDITKIVPPSTKSNTVLQQAVKGIRVHSTNKSVHNPESSDSGFIEIWPYQYGPENGKKIAGASNKAFDFGDLVKPKKLHGSFQFHNLERKQTIFAINNWTKPSELALGIGNAPGAHPDWTHAKNAKSFNFRRLRIYVRPKKN